jgi:Tfp pilus assembly protein PilO
MRAQRDYSQTLANRRLLANKGRIEALRAELRRNLMGVAISSSTSHTTAVLVQDLDRTARSQSCALISVEPVHVNGKPSVQDLPFDITVRGRFPNLLHVIATLPRAHTLLQVSGVTFTISAGQPGGPERTPLLDARIHSVVYRLNGAQYLGDV